MLDIESLYTNVSHEETIVAFLRRQKHNLHKVFVLDLLKYVLKNNVIQFDGHYVGFQWGLNSPQP